MITRVIGSAGQVLHSCADAGCTVSWDGYALVDNLQVDAPGGETTTVNRGDRVPGALDPDPARWTVSAPDARGESVATRVPDNG